MKIKLITKTIVGLFPILIIWFYLEMNPLGYVDNEVPNYMWNEYFVSHEAENSFRTVVLGDSAANSFIMPELLNDSAVNISLGGCTPIEEYLILKEYLSVHEKPNDIIMAFNEQHMLLEDCFWERIEFSHRMNIEQEREIFSAAIKYDEPSIIHNGWKWDYLQYKLRCPTKYIKAFMNGGINQREKENRKSIIRQYEHLGRYIGDTCVGYTPEKKALVSGEYKVTPLMNEYMEKILQVCQDNNITVHIIKLPKSEDVTYDSDYIDSVYDYYSGLMKNRNNVTFHFFESSYSSEYMCDTVHANNLGASILSKELHEMYYSEENMYPLSDRQKTSIKIYMKHISGKEQQSIFLEDLNMDCVIFKKVEIQPDKVHVVELFEKLKVFLNK